MPSTDHSQALAYELYKSFKGSELSYIFHGQFSQDLTDQIVTLAEHGMGDVGETAKLKKRVFSIMIESLQNITRHQDDTGESPGFFAIEKKEGNYFITTVNPILNENIAHVTSLLKKLESLTPEELKLYYKAALVENQMSSKGGAGLGLIEMARKSNNKVSYHFHPINETYSYFYYHTCINTVENKEQLHDTQLASIDNVYLLHRFLQEHKVSILYNGTLNQENLVNLLGINDTQMSLLGNKRKTVFRIMVEMLQNIVKHGEKAPDGCSSPCIFFMSRDRGHFALNTGNHIQTAATARLRERIDHLNNLNEQELTEFYNSCLFDFKVDNSKEAGLGLIELRLKSRLPLRYAINSVDDQTSFFSLQTRVAQSQSDSN